MILIKDPTATLDDHPERQSASCDYKFLIIQYIR